jgi:SAM-dependent methyltransferase
MDSIDKYIYYYDKLADKVKIKIMRNTAFSSEENSYSHTFERTHSNERASRFISEDINGKSIMDFGCDDGGILIACKQLGAGKIVGIDLNPIAIERAKEAAAKKSIKDSSFFVGDIENKVFLSSLDPVDTVLLLSVLGTSEFSSTESVIANVSRFAKSVMYYEGHYSPESRIKPIYDLMMFTDFTRFEYLGRYDWRIFIRCSRELISESQVPEHAITSDDLDEKQYAAEEVYVFSNAKHNPVFSRTCRLIQFVK